LNALEFLWCSGAGFYGSLPATIGNLKFINELYFDMNALTGSIPSSVGNLERLQKLYLNSNILTSTIPSTVANLSNLSKLHLVIALWDPF